MSAVGRRVRGATRAPLLLVALRLLVACGGEPAPAPPPEPPALLRLWREGLAGVQVATAPQPAASERVLLDLAAPDGQAWSVISAPASPTATSIPVQPLRLAPGDELPAGALGVVHTLECRPGEALALRVRARALDAAPGKPFLIGAAIELRRPFDASEGLGVDEVAKLVDPRSSATHALTGAWDPAHLELHADFVVDRATVQLALVLLVPRPNEARAVAVDGLQLVARPVAAHLRALGEFPRLTRLDPRGAVRVALDGEWREGLLALPGTRYSFTLPADARERRLDLSLGVAPRDPALSGSVRLRVEADGQPLLDETLHAPTRPEQPAWRDTTLALPAGCKTLAFSAEGQGDDPPPAVFGHPSVRARVAIAGGAGAGGANEAKARRPNVVLISLDTLRPDHLGCYGGSKEVSPRLDALAAQGLRFSQAYSVSSYTLPSHASMLTGQYPAVHGAVDRRDHLDPSCSPFLARLLADAGYVTAAFTGGGYVSPTYGFAEGFDRYSVNDPVWALDELRGRMLLATGEERNGERASAKLALLRRYAAPMIASWIERQQDGVPFFLFLHTYIAHNYAPDKQRLEQFGLLGEQDLQEPFTHHKDRDRYNDGGPFPEGAEALRASLRKEYLAYYDATIAMADEFVGGVLDALERAGLARDTIVIVTSDHGEEFGEHAFFGHGETLFEAAVRVPLIARLPERLAAAPGGARRQPAVLDGPVSQVDYAPWILRLVGVKADPRMSAPAPFGPTSADPPARTTLVMELDTERNQLSALRDGALKLIHLIDGKSPGLTTDGGVLFDIAQDASESADLGGASPDAQQRLALLQAFHELAQRARADCVAPERPVDAETREFLQQIGYGY